MPHHRLFYPLSILMACFCTACTPDLAPAAAPPEPTPAPAPNILLLVADDLGWADLNCYGSHLVESPHLDQLASNGLQFMQAYAAAPLGRPGRAGLQTGINPHHLGFITNPKATLDPDHATLGDLAHDAGYQTALIGKWGLGGTPTDHGYTHTYATAETQPQSYYHPFFHQQAPQGLLADTKAGDYLTDALTNKTIHLIEQFGDQPWLINLNFYAPHVPIEPRQDWLQHYTELIDSTHWRPFPQPAYAAMVSTIDENVGRLVTALRSLDQLDNTLIIFVSDNGGLHVRAPHGAPAHTPPTNNGILRAGKGSLYEGGIRVPFIIHWPNGIGQRKASLSPVITTDLFPALAEVVHAVGPGAAAPDGQAARSQAYLWNHDNEDRTLYWHLPYDNEYGSPAAAAIRQGDHKLYQNRDTDSLTYFNIKARPSEDLPMARPPIDKDLYRKLIHLLNE